MLKYLALPTVVAGTFNFTRCPSLHEFQASHVATDFDLEEYKGFYYEMAFHDIFQALCLKASCVNSNKTIETFSDGQGYVNEEWGLQCFGKDYPQVLQNNLTDVPGQFQAFVGGGFLESIIGNVVFPNTVVDHKPGPDGWSLEFQCVEQKVLGIWHVPYIGINFYARQPTEQAYQEMIEAGKKSGIDFYYGSSGFNFRRVDHTNCSNEPSSLLV
jgi:hypothetical protein